MLQSPDLTSHLILACGILTTVVLGLSITLVILGKAYWRALLKLRKLRPEPANHLDAVVYRNTIREEQRRREEDSGLDLPDPADLEGIVIEGADVIRQLIQELQPADHGAV